MSGTGARASTGGAAGRLAPRAGARADPRARWRRPCGTQGRVLGDAEVLGAGRQLRSELVGSGPLEPLLADPAVTDVLVSAPDRVWVDRGGGLELTSVSLRGRGGRTAAGPAPRRGGRTAAGRRPALGRRPAARRDPAARGAAAGRGRLRLPVAAGGTAAGLHPRRAGRGRHGAAGRGPDAARPARRSAVVPGQRRYRHRKDDAAERPARAGGAGRADRPRRGLGGAAARPPACRAAGDQTRQPGGRGPRHPRGPGAPGAADAAGPAGRRRGPRGPKWCICWPR